MYFIQNNSLHSSNNRVHLNIEKLFNIKKQIFSKVNTIFISIFIM